MSEMEAIRQRLRAVGLWDGSDERLLVASVDSALTFVESLLDREYLLCIRRENSEWAVDIAAHGMGMGQAKSPSVAIAIYLAALQAEEWALEAGFRPAVQRSIADTWAVSVALAKARGEGRRP